MSDTIEATQDLDGADFDPYFDLDPPLPLDDDGDPRPFTLSEKLRLPANEDELIQEED